MSKMLIGGLEDSLTSAVREFFSPADYTVQCEKSGLRILERLLAEQYEIILLETTIGGLDSLDIIQRYRTSGGTAPILLLAPEHNSQELQQGLDAGADVYIAQPFQLADLAAQIRALIRRPTLQSIRMVTGGGIAMDAKGGTVTRNDILIHLHPMEFKLLEFLMTHPNQVFSVHALFERVWQKDFGLSDDTVRTHIRTLRRKVDTTGSASVITTVRGQGYKTEHR